MAVQPGAAPVYYYHFDHLGSFSLGDIFGSHPTELIGTFVKKAFGYKAPSKQLGVSHGDDLFYLFCAKFVAEGWLELFHEQVDFRMIELMVETWTNFAAYGKPATDDDKWPRYRAREYAILKDARIHLGNDAKVDERQRFWRSQIQLFYWKK